MRIWKSRREDYGKRSEVSKVELKDRVESILVSETLQENHIITEPRKLENI